MTQPDLAELERYTPERADELHAIAIGLLDLVKEYEAQWGSDYLAEKWGLTVERERLEERLNPFHAEKLRHCKHGAACCAECDQLGPDAWKPLAEWNRIRELEDSKNA